MICDKCQNNNPDDKYFCSVCGARLKGKSSKSSNLLNINSDAKSSEQPKHVSTEQESDKKSSNKKFDDGTKDRNMETVKEGVLSAAWKDITKAKGGFAKYILAGLIGAVPILRWFSKGWALNWSVEVTKGVRHKFPDSIATDKNFKTGLFATIVEIIFAYIIILSTTLVQSLFVGSMALSIIVGIAIVVFCVFYEMFKSLAVVRGAMCENLSGSFKLKKLLSAFKKNKGSLFVATFLCKLIFVAIAVICFLVIVLICGLNMLPVLAQVFTTSGSASLMTGVTSLIMSLFVSGTLFMILTICIGLFLNTLADILSYRAVAHWVSRYAKDLV